MARHTLKELIVRFQKQPPQLFCNKRCAILLKKRLWHRCFPVNFAKFLRTPFLQNRTRPHDYFFTWFCGPNAWKNQRKFSLSYLAPLSLVWDSSFPFACRLYDTNNAKKRKTFEKSQKRLSFNHTIIFITSK